MSVPYDWTHAEYRRWAMDLALRYLETADAEHAVREARVLEEYLLAGAVADGTVAPGVEVGGSPPPEPAAGVPTEDGAAADDALTEAYAKALDISAASLLPPRTP